MTRRHQELIAWRGSVALVKAVYQASSDFPREDLTGFTSQFRRASVDIPSTIAEGSARPTIQEFLQFLGVAIGQLAVLETHVAIARELGYLDESEKLTGLIDDVAELVSNLIASVHREPAQDT